MLLFLMLLPTYQFHAQRFNANTVLLAIWPLATYCFLRSFEIRHVAWAFAAGLTAAIAMLGKYYSIFLIGSFAFAAMVHPQRRVYFLSSTPWVSTITGLAALGPHLYWLATTGAEPFQYALAAQGGVAFGASSVEALFFLLGLAAAMMIPIVTWIMIAGYRLRRFPDDFRAMNSGLLLLFFVSTGTIAFPVITAVTLGPAPRDELLHLSYRLVTRRQLHRHRLPVAQTNSVPTGEGAWNRTISLWLTTAARVLFIFYQPFVSKALSRESLVGTVETCPPTVAMSAHGVRPEVVAYGQTGANVPRPRCCLQSPGEPELGPIYHRDKHGTIRLRVARTTATN